VNNKDKYKLFPFAAKWVIWCYGLLGLCLIPWTLYLAQSLPIRAVARNWDIAWVGFDVFILITILANVVFAIYRSKFLVMSLVTTSVLLAVDAWFDVIVSRSGRPIVVAISEALIFELPLALISFSIALNLISKLDFKDKK
jgi:hypothetical protein